MALAMSQSELTEIVRLHLDSCVRYKCIVMQVSDLYVISQLSNILFDRFHESDIPVTHLSHSDFFDSVGAIASGAANDLIFGHARNNLVLTCGPLHFLDYWSEPTQKVFWQTLASFSEGLGVILIDVLRNEGIDGPFRVVGKLADTEIRVFKSRLSLFRER